VRGVRHRGESCGRAARRLCAWHAAGDDDGSVASAAPRGGGGSGEAREGGAMSRYNPRREEPQTYAQLLSWLMVRLPAGVEAVGRRSAVSWRFVDVGQAEWSIRGAVGSTEQHLPEVAAEFTRHADRVELAECAAQMRAAR